MKKPLILVTGATGKTGINVVEQLIDAVAHEQLAPFAMTRLVLLAATPASQSKAFAQFAGKPLVVLGVSARFLAGWLQLRPDGFHTASKR